MSRLTKKNINGYDLVQNGEIYCVWRNDMTEKIIHKLGNFEDLEEELGCPLEIAFKALEKGIIVKTTYGTSHRSVDLGKHYLNKKLTYCFTCEEPPGFGDWDCEEYSRPIEYYNLKDYQKTWWLEEEKNY